MKRLQRLFIFTAAVAAVIAISEPTFVADTWQLAAMNAMTVVQVAARDFRVTAIITAIILLIAALATLVVVLDRESARCQR